MSRLLEFETLNNTRDLGGMKTSDHRVIKKGKLIRSGQLAQASDPDLEQLGRMVSLVLDFRSASEIEEKRDRIPEGVEYRNLPVLESIVEGISRDKKSEMEFLDKMNKKPDETRDYMIRMYRGLSRNEFAVSQVRTFLDIILEEHPKAVLWHCSAGKDRAGVVAALLEEILGVPRETVIQDYIATNDYLVKDVQSLKKIIRSQVDSMGEIDERALYNFLGANREYIEAFYDEIDQTYHGFQGFLRDALHLTEEEQNRLKEMYLQEDE